MALGEKYRVYANHGFGGDDRYVKIYQDGYSGSVTNIIGSGDPVNVEWPGAGDDNILSPIMGTELRVVIMEQTADEFIEFSNAKNKEYLAVLYNDDQSDIEWQGWLFPQEYESPFTHPPYPITLIFSCGLGSLATEDYLNSGAYYTGRTTEILILANCLASITPASPLNADIYVAIGLVPTGASTAITFSALSLSYTNQEKYINEDGTVWNKLDVIRDILEPYGARIVMGRDGWWVSRIRDFALLADSKDIHYVIFNSSGVVQGNGILNANNAVLEYTGPNINGRATDVSWAGGNQKRRFERAYQEARVWLNRGYKNMFILKDFDEEWESFWTLDSTSAGSAELVQDTDDPDKSNLFLYDDWTDEDVRVSQTFNVNVEAGDQNLIFSAETMAEADAESDLIILQIVMYLDADSGSANDRWLRAYFNATDPSGGITPEWSSFGFEQYVRWETKDPGQWKKVDVTSPPIPFTGVLKVQLLNPVSSLSAGRVDGGRWRRVSLLGAYFGLAPIKITKEELTISTDNIVNPDPTMIYSGDVVDQGNERIFLKNGKSRNSDGTNQTTTWRSYYASGGSKVAYGPQQELVKYRRDNIVIQHGLNRKRLEGTIAADYSRLANSVFKIDGVYYVFTSLRQSVIAGLIKCSMVELPPIEDVVIDTNLITAWSNFVPPWDTLTITTQPLIDTAADSGGSPSGVARANDIESLVAYESFRVRVSGTFSVFKPTLAIGSWSSTIQDGTDVVITPKTTAGANTVTLTANTGAASSHTNVLITVTRIYGF